MLPTSTFTVLFFALRSMLTMRSSGVIKAVLLDLSGNIHVGNKMIPGALEAVQKLIDHGILVKFVTNTTKRSRKETIEELWGMGFSKNIVKPTTVVTTAQASSELIRRQNLTPYCLIQESLLGDLDLESMPEKELCNCVLVGLAPEAFNYGRLNEAFRVLMREIERRKEFDENQKHEVKPPLLIALHRGKYLRDVDDGLSLGPGGFVACLQEAAGLADSDIAVMGKPSRDFFYAAIPHDVMPEETAMVGDDVQQDVIGAKQAGLGLGILVRTGKYQVGDDSVAIGNHTPDATVDSIVEAVDLILERSGTLHA